MDEPRTGSIGEYIDRDSSDVVSDPVPAPPAGEASSLRHIVFQGAPSPPPPPRRADDHDLRAVRHSRAEPVATLDGPASRFYDRLFTLGNMPVARYRSTVLERRVAACLRALRAKDLERATAMLDEDERAVERALRAVMIGVTSFFRDPRVFDAVGPFLTELSTFAARPLRVLSVGCSDGSEVYSVAIKLGELGLAFETIDGIDCRRDAIRAAREGAYSRDQLDHLPETIISRYFNQRRARQRNVWQVKDEIRSRCRWRVADALDVPFQCDYDLILCRNLFIYLTTDAATRLWTKLRDCLAEDGLLMVGRAERPLLDDGLRRLAPSLYRRCAQES